MDTMLRDKKPGTSGGVAQHISLKMLVAGQIKMKRPLENEVYALQLLTAITATQSSNEQRH